MTFDPNQKRGQPKNRGSWVAGDNSDPEAVMTLPHLQGIDGARRWMELSGRYLNDEGAAELAARFDADPHMTSMDRGQTFKEVYKNRNGYTESDFSDYNTAMDVLIRAGYQAEAAGLERYIAGRAQLAAPGVHAVPIVSSGPPQTADASGDLPLTEDQKLAYENDALLSHDPRLQAGQVFDRVVHGGKVFHRRRDGVYPGWPDDFRVQADRPISDEEANTIAGVLGYGRAKHLRGEPLSDIERDSPYSFIVGTDLTKSRSDDVGMALGRWEDEIPQLLREGSDLRSTNRAGPDTKGTRAVYGLGDDAPHIELYYDNVTS